MNKQHQLRWMRAGGARELNALQPLEARERGGHVSGQRAAKSGRLRVASAKGVARIHEIMREEATK